VLRLVLGIAFFCWPGLVWAQSDPMDRINRALGVLDDRVSEQYAFSARLRPDYVPDAEPEEAPLPRYRGSYSGPWLQVARDAARRNDIPEDLFLRLVSQESAWDPEAVSHAGATGLAQLRPDTAMVLGVDPTDPVANLDGGARYLAQQFRTFGNWRLALAAYNAGPAAVHEHNGVPLFPETQDYVRIILGTGG
jgi:soluble lytic murein transglycosylase-like protein